MTVLPGKIYQHKKGPKYLVREIVRDSTNARDGLLGVIYVSVADESVHYRDLSEFEELVEWPDGQMRPRFVLEEEATI